MNRILASIKDLWDDPKKRKITVIVAVSLFACMILFFGYKIAHTLITYKEEAQLHEELLGYKPDEVGSGDLAEEDEPVSDHSVVINQSLIDLKATNKDVVGWINIPDTQIDYPFVRAADNDYYLRRNLYGKWLDTGTLFLDYRNDPDMLSFYSLIYGHHMKNGSVFGAISYYAEQSFFDKHPYGYIYTPYQNFRMDFFAYLVVAGNEKNVYDPENIEKVGNLNTIKYFQTNARTSLPVNVKASDRIVVLSTCSYEFGNARSILVGKLVPLSAK
ncbi:MAG: class B sortase [Clostridia bacterium]|nr:class B sortase [Clostridia bacterium]